MSCVFLYNGQSPKKRIVKNLDFIKQELTKAFGSCDIFGLKGIEEVEKFYREQASNYDYLIHSGGDGTFNLICNYIDYCEKKPIIGYLPGGTACDNMRKYHLKKNIKYCLKVYAKKNTVPVETIKVNDTYSSYTISKGKFVKVSYETTTKDKKKFGRLAYIIRGVEAFFKKESFKMRMTFDDKVIEDKYSVLILTNSNSVAGIKFKKEFDKGVINVYAFRGCFLKIALFFLFGEKCIKLLRKADHYQAKNFKFELLECKDNEWSNDGERMKGDTLDISVRENHFNILV
jgi:diacylglycerol kinase (ATP)